MASEKQRRGARKNVKKAISAARKKKTIAHMPKKTRTALGKQGAAVARRQRSGGSEPKTRPEPSSTRRPSGGTFRAAPRWAGASRRGLWVIGSRHLRGRSGHC